MDPYDFGVRYTSDPIPTIRSLRSSFPGGWVIVPEEFGGSVNTEFEVLTGMSMCFLPKVEPCLSAVPATPDSIVAESA